LPLTPASAQGIFDARMMITLCCRRAAGPALASTIALAALLLSSGSVAAAQGKPAETIAVKAVPRAGATPPWNKGILPINSESYWNAVACGKQGGQDPACVFFDTGLCKNDDFALALFTPYKMVAYEVWRVVQQKQPPPTPNYAEAQRTRVTVGVTPVPGSKNRFTTLVLKRGGKQIAPVDRSTTTGGGRFTFDYPAFAATAGITLDLVGQLRTVACTIDAPVMRRLR
jgi:hypothetical protein